MKNSYMISKWCLVLLCVVLNLNVCDYGYSQAPCKDCPGVIKGPQVGEDGEACEQCFDGYCSELLYCGDIAGFLECVESDGEGLNDILQGIDSELCELWDSLNYLHAWHDSLHNDYWADTSELDLGCMEECIGSATISPWDVIELLAQVACGDTPECMQSPCEKAGAWLDVIMTNYPWSRVSISRTNCIPISGTLEGGGYEHHYTGSNGAGIWKLSTDGGYSWNTIASGTSTVVINTNTINSHSYLLQYAASNGEWVDYNFISNPYNACSDYELEKTKIKCVAEYTATVINSVGLSYSWDLLYDNAMILAVPMPGTGVYNNGPSIVTMPAPFEPDKLLVDAIAECGELDSVLINVPTCPPGCGDPPSGEMELYNNSGSPAQWVAEENMNLENNYLICPISTVPVSASIPLGGQNPVTGACGWYGNSDVSITYINGVYVEFDVVGPDPMICFRARMECGDIDHCAEIPFTPVCDIAIAQSDECDMTDGSDDMTLTLTSSYGPITVSSGNPTSINGVYASGSTITEKINNNGVVTGIATDAAGCMVPIVAANPCVCALPSVDIVYISEIVGVSRRYQANGMPGGGSYDWSPNSALVSADGTNTVDVSYDYYGSLSVVYNTPCGNANDDVDIECPAVSVSISVGSVAGSYTATGGSVPGTYSWTSTPSGGINGASNTATVSVVSGYYGVLTVVYDIGCDSASASVDVECPATTVSASIVSDVCDDSETITAVGGGPGVGSYSWLPANAIASGAGTATVVIVDSYVGNVTVTYTNECGNSSSAVVAIGQNDFGIIFASLTCNPDGSGNVQYAIPFTNGPVTISNAIPANMNGVYTTSSIILNGVVPSGTNSSGTATDVNGCTTTFDMPNSCPACATAQVSVSVNYNCGNDVVTATGSAPVGSYSWSPVSAIASGLGTAVVTLVPSYVGSLSVTYTNSCGNVDVETVTIAPNPFGIPSYNGTCSSGVMNLNVSIPFSNGPVTWATNIPSMNGVYSGSSPSVRSGTLPIGGSLNGQVTDALGCKIDLSYQNFCTVPPVDPTGDITVGGDGSPNGFVDTGSPNCVPACYAYEVLKDNVSVQVDGGYTTLAAAYNAYNNWWTTVCEPELLVGTDVEVNIYGSCTSTCNSGMGSIPNSWILLDEYCFELCSSGEYIACGTGNYNPMWVQIGSWALPPWGGGLTNRFYYGLDDYSADGSSNEYELWIPLGIAQVTQSGTIFNETQSGTVTVCDRNGNQLFPPVTVAYNNTYQKIYSNTTNFMPHTDDEDYYKVKFTVIDPDGNLLETDQWYADLQTNSLTSTSNDGSGYTITSASCDYDQVTGTFSLSGVTSNSVNGCDSDCVPNPCNDDGDSDNCTSLSPYRCEAPYCACGCNTNYNTCGYIDIENDNTEDVYPATDAYDSNSMGSDWQYNWPGLNDYQSHPSKIVFWSSNNCADMIGPINGSHKIGYARLVCD